MRSGGPFQSAQSRDVLSSRTPAQKVHMSDTFTDFRPEFSPGSNSSPKWLPGRLFEHFQLASSRILDPMVIGDVLQFQPKCQFGCRVVRSPKQPDRKSVV